MEKTANLNKSVRLIFTFALVMFLLTLVGCGTLVHHKVEKGDSLYSVGFYYGQDYQDIAQWNDISSPYTLQIGQWLRVVPPEKDWRDGRKKNAVITSATNRKFRNNNAVSSTSINTTQRTLSPNRVRSPPLSLADNAFDHTKPVKAWLWPSSGKLMNPNKSFSKRKNGIDIKGRRGQAVRATAAGKVVYRGSGLIGYGKLLIVKHNKTYLSAYAYNDAMLVKEGDTVKSGQTIAKMGMTPDQQILLHFEIRKNGKPVDPLRLLKRPN